MSVMPSSSKGAILTSPDQHPKAVEPVTLILTVLLSILGAVIGLHLITTLGITANTSVIGALVAMMVARIPISRQLRKLRSVHRQNLVQTAISGATFAAANSLLVPIAVPYVLGRADLVWPMLLGAAIGLTVDIYVLYRIFDSKLFPARDPWPSGVASAETIIAGDEGGRKALVLGLGGLVGFVGSFLKVAGNALPFSAAGVAFIGNVWALAMFGIGLGARQYGEEWFGVNLDELYIPHGFMVGAGLVALLQAVLLLSRREPGAGRREAEQEAAERNERLGVTVNEVGLRKALTQGYLLFTSGALVVALLGGILGDLGPLGLLGWCLLAGFGALVHQMIVGLAAMHSGWFPAFAVTLIFLVLGLVIGIPTVGLALFTAYVAATGPAFADMGYDLKAGWMLRQGSTPHLLVERAGRKQQVFAGLVGAGVALAVVALTWQSYFSESSIPPVSEVYAATVEAGLGDPGVLTNILIWAVPGAIIQFIGGPRRQMGVLLATGLLILTPYAVWFVLGALAIRLIWIRVKGEEAAMADLYLVGSGVIAGNSLTDVSRVFRGSA